MSAQATFVLTVLLSTIFGLVLVLGRYVLRKVRRKPLEPEPEPEPKPRIVQKEGARFVNEYGFQGSSVRIPEVEVSGEASPGSFLFTDGSFGPAQSETPPRPDTRLILMVDGTGDSSFKNHPSKATEFKPSWVVASVLQVVLFFVAFGIGSFIERRSSAEEVQNLTDTYSAEVEGYRQQVIRLGNIVNNLQQSRVLQEQREPGTIGPECVYIRNNWKSEQAPFLVQCSADLRTWWTVLRKVE